jgi:hypothetical protein
MTMDDLTRRFASTSLPDDSSRMEARETRNMISTMPKEILLEIASYLPITSLSRFTRTDCNLHTEIIDELHTRAVKANKGTVALAHAARYNHVG